MFTLSCKNVTSNSLLSHRFSFFSFFFTGKYITFNLLKGHLGPSVANDFNSCARCFTSTNMLLSCHHFDTILGTFCRAKIDSEVERGGSVVLPKTLCMLGPNLGLSFRVEICYSWAKHHVWSHSWTVACLSFWIILNQQSKPKHIL